MDGEAMDWKERFSQLPLDKQNKFKKGSCKLCEREVLGGVFFLCYFSWEMEEKEDES
jgi:hypothetical protein